MSLPPPVPDFLTKVEDKAFCFGFEISYSIAIYSAIFACWLDLKLTKDVIASFCFNFSLVIYPLRLNGYYY
jgi:hypothetical protein